MYRRLRILCVLQNAWGRGRLPITFVPSPHNKSAKTIKKMVGDNYYEFSNTTDEVTPTPAGRAKPNYAHFERLIRLMGRYDLILVCGRQAEETVNKYIREIKVVNKNILFVPHPASRTLSNVQCAEIREKIRKFER